MTGSFGRSDIVDIACVILHETELAWLIDAGTDDHVWIPKSIGNMIRQMALSPCPNG
jgi:hypothetical protein